MSTYSRNESPIRFGATSLFGFYHPPATPTPRGAVLLCAPIGQDQIRSHRLYRLLAQTITDLGYAVLRFDCFGTGDSPGDALDVDWRTCVDNAVEAATTLRQRSGCRTVTGYGVRLGANLALEATAPAGLEHLILWEPVLDGAAYARQLDAWQEQLRHDPDRYTHRRSVHDAAGQWLGFAVSPTLRAQITALKPVWPDIPTTLLRSAGTPPPAVPDHVRQVALAGPSPWLGFEWLETMVLAPDVVQASCALLGEPA